MLSDVLGRVVPVLGRVGRVGGFSLWSSICVGFMRPSARSLCKDLRANPRLILSRAPRVATVMTSIVVASEYKRMCASLLWRAFLTASFLLGLLLDPFLFFVGFLP